jgi:hypothetical protein
MLWCTAGICYLNYHLTPRTGIGGPSEALHEQSASDKTGRSTSDAETQEVANPRMYDPVKGIDGR